MSLDYSMVWVTIAAQDFQKTYDFYYQLLGQLPDRTQGPSDRLIYAEFHLTGLRLGIYRPKPQPNSGSSNAVSMELERPELERPELEPTESDRTELEPSASEPTELESSDLPNPEITTPLSLCFQVCDLDRSIELLQQLGYPVPGQIVTASHGREVYAYDPDGNRLILYQPNLHQPNLHQSKSGNTDRTAG